MLFVLSLPTITLACWGGQINGPSVVCPQSENVYTIDYTSLGCPSVQGSIWRITDGTASGIFTDGFGNMIGNGKELNCGSFPGAQCNTNSDYPIYIKSSNSYGNFLLEFFAGCGLWGTIHKEKVIDVGMLPPAIINSPPEGCVNNTIAVSATQVNQAFSYTWEVPNSSYQINGISGPFVTVNGQAGSAVSLTIGSPIGGGVVGVRANMENCVGNGFTQKALNIYSTTPSLQDWISFSSYCSYQTVTVTGAIAPNATSYRLEVTDMSGFPILVSNSSSPSFSFTAMAPGNYNLGMRGVNSCGWGPLRQIPYTTSSCGGNPPQQQVILTANPNPADDFIEVKAELNTDNPITINDEVVTDEQFKEQEMKFVISSAQGGRKVYEHFTKEKSFKIDVRSIPRGQYVLAVSGLGVESRRHIIISNRGN